MEQFNHNEHPHRRYNPLLDEWILVSPHRAKRPWQGQKETVSEEHRPEHDKECYLCAGNVRANGVKNPDYADCYVFENDFSALLTTEVNFDSKAPSLFQLKPERGINKVVCFSPKHNLTLPEMEVEAIEKVVQTWKAQYIELGKNEHIKYIQIFENKGEIMGCSNPHPHGQIWASSSVPLELTKETTQQKKYFEQHGKSLLSAYLDVELQKKERIVAENEHFVALVPYWAVWPYETMLISKRHVQTVTQFTAEEDKSFAGILKALTIKYDKLFDVSFPYSAGMHQMPVNDGEYKGWHWHMHFYPPLLRSATVKKFMVGYEMLANPQRDITPEQVAKTLQEL